MPGIRCFIDMKGRPGSFARSFYELAGQKMRNGYEEREIDETEMSRSCSHRGRPESKGVMLTHKSILAAAEGGLAYLEIGEVCLPSCRYTIRLNVRTES